MENDPRAAYAAFQAEVQKLVSSPLWGQIESELKRLRPPNPDPVEPTFVVAQRSLLCMGYDRTLEMIRLIPTLDVPVAILAGQTSKPGSDDELIQRVADPKH